MHNFNVFLMRGGSLKMYYRQNTLPNNNDTANEENYKFGSG